jgi:hypothetical protein
VVLELLEELDDDELSDVLLLLLLLLLLLSEWNEELELLSEVELLLLDSECSL